MGCSHFVCTRKAKGVVVCVVDVDERCVLMGKERFGRYKNKWNLCAGSVEECDDGCLIAAAIRELKEEFKLRVPLHEWPLYFRKCYWLAATAVFVIKPPSVDPSYLNALNQASLGDTKLPSTHHEIQEITWVQLGTDENLPISALAKYIMKKFFNSPKHSCDATTHDSTVEWSKSC